MGFSLSSFGGGALDFISKGLDIAASEGQMHEQMNFNESMFKRRYQMTVADLKAAGLNPALAVGGLGGGAPSAGGGGGGGAAMQVGGTAMRARQAELLAAEADAASASAAKSRGDTLSPGIADKAALAASGAAVASAERASQDTVNLKEQVGEIGMRIKDMQSQIDKRGVETSTLQMLQSFQVQMAKFEAELKRLQLPQAKVAADIAEQAGKAVEKAREYSPGVIDYIASELADWALAVREEFKQPPGSGLRKVIKWGEDSYKSRKGKGK